MVVEGGRPPCAYLLLSIVVVVDPVPLPLIRFLFPRAPPPRHQEDDHYYRPLQRPARVIPGIVPFTSHKL